MVTPQSLDSVCVVHNTFIRIYKASLLHFMNCRDNIVYYKIGIISLEKSCLKTL